jgi:hypothetical protein
MHIITRIQSYMRVHAVSPALVGESRLRLSTTHPNQRQKLQFAGTAAESLKQNRFTGSQRDGAQPLKKFGDPYAGYAEIRHCVRTEYFSANSDRRFQHFSAALHSPLLGLGL